MDDEKLDLRLRIKELLKEDPEFVSPSFDPAPFLIQILKDKSADPQALETEQQDLIMQENRAYEILDEICGEEYEEFMKFLDTPALYAEQLEKLKSNVSVVKKKVKETKALLLNTQKDIQQIHYNCMFNKIVYKELKKIEVRLQEYETAHLALKNNQFYLCALNLPFVEGQTMLESTLTSRSETLRLRMMSRAIDELILFLFFSPKVTLPSSNVFLERVHVEQGKGANDIVIANWEEQIAFFKRFKLFKKAEPLDYLSKIWEFDDYSRKAGKLGLVYDIIKGIIRIGRISEITSSIELYTPRHIANIFLLLKYFKLKEEQEKEVVQNQSENLRWFIDRCSQDESHKNFISAMMNVIGVVFRKVLILRMIYREFEQKELLLNTGMIYKVILLELKKIIELLYFPEIKNLHDNLGESNEEQINEQIKQKLAKSENYINYGYSNYLIYQSLSLIEINVADVEEKMLDNPVAQKDLQKKGMEMLAGFQEIFYANFHRSFMKTLEEIFCKDGHYFVMESFDTIINYKPFNSEEIKYMKGFKSEDRKAIREYIFLLSFMKSMEEFFEQNHLSSDRLHKYLAMCLLFFYLKLNHHITTNLILTSDALIIEEQRKKDSRMKKKYEDLKKMFQKILTEKVINESISEKYESKFMNQSNPSTISQNSFYTTDKLKVISKQNEMLLIFSSQFFKDIEEYKNIEEIPDFMKSISKLEPANYNEQVQPKLNRVWEALPDSEKFLKGYVACVLYKMVDLQCLVAAKIYRETGLI